MQILSKTVKKPEDGDKGSVWFPALEFDLELLNDHAHNGTNSTAIPSLNITPVKLNIAAGSWVAAFSPHNGIYKSAVLTVPNPQKTVDDCVLMFKDSLGRQLHLGVEKVASNTFYVYINDPIDITVYFVV
jgi:hypothetical protein